MIILLSCMLTFSHSYLSVHHAVFENILVPFRRDIIKRKENFLYPGTDSFKTGNMDKPSADYIIQIQQSPPQVLRFSQGRGERLVMNCKGPWEMYRRQGGSPCSPSRPPLRAHVHREGGVWVRGSIYLLHMLVE